MRRTSKCTNLFGPIKPEIRQRLDACLENPTEKTWEEAYSIIINGDHMISLWQAVVAADQTFPMTGPVETLEGKRLEGWKRVPDKVTLVRALRLAENAQSHWIGQR